MIGFGEFGVCVEMPDQVMQTVGGDTEDILDLLADLCCEPLAIIEVASSRAKGTHRLVVESKMATTTSAVSVVLFPRWCIRKDVDGFVSEWWNHWDKVAPDMTAVATVLEDW